MSSVKAKVETLGKIFNVSSRIVTVPETNVKKINDTEFEIEVKSLRVISIKVPCEMYQTLKTLAKERNTTLTEIVRTAISEYLEKEGVTMSEKKS